MIFSVSFTFQTKFVQILTDAGIVWCVDNNLFLENVA